MATVEQPMFILPKKRNGKKPITLNNHVDHIITVQGAGDADMLMKYKNDLLPVNECVTNGIIHSTIDELKSNMKINLPIITDVTDEEANENGRSDHSESMQNEGKIGQQALVMVHREVTNLSPIYENSSDGYSSHGDLREGAESDLLRTCRLMNDSPQTTLSQTQSENSFEMGPTDSLKNSAKRKKRVNIVHDFIETENYDSEITALRVDSEDSLSPECLLTEHSIESYLTMTGTIKRGRKTGQNVDVKLNISREELEIIVAAIDTEEYNKIDVSNCSLYNGLHIFIFSLLCMPFVACLSAVYSFYMGTLAWFNIFTHVTEELPYIKKVFLVPVLIILYPFLIVIITISLGVYAGIVQLTFSGANWLKDVCDLEKGFYGWLCNTMGISQCSP